MTRSKALALRALIEKAAISLPDEDALEGVELFPKWKEQFAYALGDRVQYEAKLYKCVQALRGGHPQRLRGGVRMVSLMQRRREMMKKTGPSFPITVSAPMGLSKICNGGTISNKPDWRSSGYVEIPTGATKVRWKNYSSKNYFRVGLPDSDTQTSGITMLNSSNSIQVNQNATSSKYSVGAHKYVYLSRSGTDTSAIDVIFLKE